MDAMVVRKAEQEKRFPSKLAQVYSRGHLITYFRQQLSFNCLSDVRPQLALSLD
jgi:hypothetical protein